MASSLPVSEGKEISLLLLGKTGHGKSFTGNSLLGWEAFAKSSNLASETITATLNCSVREDGTVVRVVDTPGVMDTENQEECTISEIMEGMSLCPNGFNALLFVIKYGIRYTAEEKRTIDILKEYFGSNFLKEFGIVIMTEGDSFDINYEDGNKSFKEWLFENESKQENKPMAELLKECNNRCVLFYNVGDEFNDKRKCCVNELFDLVKQIPTIYTSVHLELASKAREDLVTTLEIPVLHTAIQEKISLLMDQLDKDMRNNTFSYEDMKKKISALNKELEKVGIELEDKTEFLILKERLDCILRRVEDIRYSENKMTQRAEQRQMYDSLEAVKDTPTRYKIFIQKAFLIFAKILKPIGTILTFGAAHNALKEFVNHREELYETCKEEFKQLISSEREKNTKKSCFLL
ncbi:unnamed protein product [Lymnaea stagnalis]|uniref:AIG1-type G domain-containing protein n=1 Tax=Lymnaea stagnalis TaxID=6523 RepID=A0AAV2I2B6_LYMST